MELTSLPSRSTDLYVQACTPAEPHAATVSRVSENHSREVPIITDLDYGRWAWTLFRTDIQLRTARMDVPAKPSQWFCSVIADTRFQASIAISGGRPKIAHLSPYAVHHSLDWDEDDQNWVSKTCLSVEA